MIDHCTNKNSIILRSDPRSERTARQGVAFALLIPCIVLSVLLWKRSLRRLWWIFAATNFLSGFLSYVLFDMGAACKLTINLESGTYTLIRRLFGFGYWRTGLTTEWNQVVLFRAQSLRMPGEPFTEFFIAIKSKNRRQSIVVSSGSDEAAMESYATEIAQILDLTLVIASM